MNSVDTSSAEYAHRFSGVALRQLAALRRHYPTGKSVLLPALWIAQREYGGTLTREAMEEVSRLVDLPLAEVQGVATFYTMYNKQPVGRIVIEVCTSLSCAAKGAYDLLHHLEHRLGITSGQTTPDGKYTLLEVECINDCIHAPAVQIGPKYHPDMTIDRIDALLDTLDGQESQYGVVAMADAVVRCHLRDDEVNANG